MSNKYCLLLLLFSVYFNSFSKIYTTQRSGDYTDSFTWENNDGPSLNCKDTIIIKHYIELNNNLAFVSGANVKIDSIGRLCGHYTTIVGSNAYLLCLGVLQLDSLQVLGGVVDILGYGKGVFTKSVILRIGGAKMTVREHGTMAVGPWFVCNTPGEDSKINAITSSSLFSISPNPNSDFIVFDFDKNLLNQELLILDSNGKIVYQTTITDEKTRLNLNEYANGIYLVQVVSELLKVQKQIFVIAR